ncbi:hypothetical protein [Treponema sp. C6A8]|uniref:hypothetical protein n=1 Tax=Treponema sp. C6A8 TaxID=1410609 RepID=UPI00057195E2|nr:hypothetical protein [Treponema sp. C6A8]
MKRLLFVLTLLSTLFLSCSSYVSEGNKYEEFIEYIYVSSTQETRLYYCYHTITEAKAFNRGWIKNIDSWPQYAMENPYLDTNVKKTIQRNSNYKKKRRTNN